MPALHSAMQKRIHCHIAALGSSDQKAAQRAEANLIRYYGARALETQREAADSPNTDVRFRAAWALGYTRVERAIETLLLADLRPGRRCPLRRSPGPRHLGDPRAIELLIVLMCMSDPEGVYSAAAVALVKFGALAAPALLPLVRDQRREVRRVAVSVLRGIRDEVADGGAAA